jgi:hypothetical protein
VGAIESSVSLTRHSAAAALDPQNPSSHARSRRRAPPRRFAEAIGVRIQLEGVGLPTSLVQMLPYVLALIALTMSSAIAVRRMGRARRREMAPEA